MKYRCTIHKMLIPAVLCAAAAVALAQNDAAPPAYGQVNGVTTTHHEITNFVPVTDEILRHPDPNNWTMFRGNYEGWGYSSLEQINKSNVKDLQLVWARVMEPGINEATPLIYNGVMFLGNPGDIIQAIDATTGDLLWQYRRQLPPPQALHSTWGQRKRSIFLYHDKVYFVSWDNFLIALDAKTGKEIWEVNRGGQLYASNSNGPIVVDGVVIAGSTCQVAPFGCFVTGNDAETGKELWRNTFIPKPGQPGDETWGNVPFDKRWITGAWGPIIYDPDVDMVFYGSSGIGPGSEAQRHQIGLSLAGTDTRYAVEPRTGKIVWKHQVLPEDNWDQECTFEMMPITTAVHPDPHAEGMMAIGHDVDSAPRKTLTGMPCKTGIVWSFDETHGDFLWAKSTTEQNLVAKIDANGNVTINPDSALRDVTKTYRQCPAYVGGRDWPFSAYNPKTNVLYAELQNMCGEMKARTDREPTFTSGYNTSEAYEMSAGKTNLGRIDAISVETGKTLWSWETRASNYSGILTTGSGLLFNGGMDRYLRAFDEDNGKVLWQTRLGSQVLGTTVTFSVNGRQYIAVAAGGGFNPGAIKLVPDVDQPTGGNMVYVFALPQQ